MPQKKKNISIKTFFFLNMKLEMLSRQKNMKKFAVGKKDFTVEQFSPI
jgi:hypothetical protein